VKLGLEIAFTLAAILAACSYLDAHPPQVCVTADAVADGGLPDAARNPGF